MPHAVRERQVAVQLQHDDPHQTVAQGGGRRALQVPAHGLDRRGQPHSAAELHRPAHLEPHLQKHLRLEQAQEVRQLQRLLLRQHREVQEDLHQRRPPRSRIPRDMEGNTRPVPETAGLQSHTARLNHDPDQGLDPRPDGHALRRPAALQNRRGLGEFDQRVADHLHHNARVRPALRPA